ncbi:hypothetical protein ACEPPN_002737 [Leptodophora sp. 'Broadleaf-Isolate-01']
MTGSVHEDYWKHTFMNNFGLNCSFKHGQPTWYFSLMGRSTEMAKYKELRREAIKNIKTQNPTLEDWEAMRQSLAVRGIIPLRSK